MIISNKANFTVKNAHISFTVCSVLILIILLFNSGCKKDVVPTPTPIVSASYQQVNLVSDVNGYNAARIDANLSNAWGIAIGPSGSFWISSNAKGLTTVYDRNGSELLAPVSIPFQGNKNGGKPTGVVYNGSSTDFKGAKFIYCGEEGTITGWKSGDSAMLLADRSGFNAVYKGIAIASYIGGSYIYAADFHNARIDVFDFGMNIDTTIRFMDYAIPVGYAPFNIQNIDGKLYVTYAKQKAPDNEDDESGDGNGYVDMFAPNGILITRFATRGTLNSPWGITKAPYGFGQSYDDILVGNFGNGKINVYDYKGNYKGQLKDNETVISIEGLWAIAFPQNGIPAGDPNQLFFTAGPADESHGLFGYLKKK